VLLVAFANKISENKEVKLILLAFFA